MSESHGQKVRLGNRTPEGSSQLAVLGKIAPRALLLCGAVYLYAEPYVPGEPVSGTFQSRAEPFLENHCFDCHDDETSEAGLNLLELGPVDQINAAV